MNSVSASRVLGLNQYVRVSCNTEGPPLSEWHRRGSSSKMAAVDLQGATTLLQLPCCRMMIRTRWKQLLTLRGRAQQYKPGHAKSLHEWAEVTT